MADYTKQINTAYRLIKKRGMTVVYRIPIADPAADPSDSWRDPNVTYEDHDVWMVFQSFETERVDGVQILRTDIKGLMPMLDKNGQPLSFLPSDDHIVIRGNDELSVEKATPLQPAQQVIMYEFQLREKPRGI